MQHVSTLWSEQLVPLTLMLCHLPPPHKSSAWLMLATIWWHMYWPVLSNIFFPAALFLLLRLVMHTYVTVLPFLLILPYSLLPSKIRLVLSFTYIHKWNLLKLTLIDALFFFFFCTFKSLLVRAQKLSTSHFFLRLARSVSQINHAEGSWSPSKHPL